MGGVIVEGTGIDTPGVIAVIDEVNDLGDEAIG